MSRRGFLATLAAVPLAAIAAPAALHVRFTRATPVATWDGAHGLLAIENNGTIADTYAGVSRVPSRIYVYTGIDSGKRVSLR